MCRVGEVIDCRHGIHQLGPLLAEGVDAAGQRIERVGDVADLARQGPPTPGRFLAKGMPAVGSTPAGGAWTYDEAIPGPELRATAGGLLRVDLTNDLPTETSIHWHRLALSNDMDGVPGITQDPIGAGSRFVYELTTPDPGTYFFHPHIGVQVASCLTRRTEDGSDARVRAALTLIAHLNDADDDKLEPDELAQLLTWLHGMEAT